MTRPITYPYCMTLRLSTSMEAELENLAYDLHLSKAATIRRSLRRAIADAYPNKCSNAARQTHGGAR